MAMIRHATTHQSGTPGGAPLRAAWCWAKCQMMAGGTRAATSLAREVVVWLLVAQRCEDD